ncbi:20.3 kDa [Spodoptera frugiperda ascovirus 1a]|uniref:20.3 kDa n=1 Tax=Spodoptera frugiperda ascovirus 1a TaxID=113370 RepID=Q0E529_SFAVA|nr:20.3 kDa [Spodoptera frugiperda ascovirus 1a]CAL44672.1 20.3 kDa [Spodoptera frugiperda ascovirus 1a]
MSITNIRFGDRVINVLTINVDGELWYHAMTVLSEALEDSLSGGEKSIERIVSSYNIRTDCSVECYPIEIQKGRKKAKRYSLCSLFINHRGLHELVLGCDCKFSRMYKHYLVNEYVKSVGVNPLREFELWYSQSELGLLCRDESVNGYVYIATNVHLSASGVYALGCAVDLDARLKRTR